jgi:hypothetical protein
MSGPGFSDPIIGQEPDRDGDDRRELCVFNALTDHRFRVKIDQHRMVLIVEPVAETEDAEHLSRRIPNSVRPFLIVVLPARVFGTQ